MSSSTTLSNTTLTSCLTVAAAVFIVTLSLVKCRRKHKTIDCKERKSALNEHTAWVIKVISYFKMSMPVYIEIMSSTSSIQTLASASCCTTVLVVMSSIAVWSSFNSSTPASIKIHRALIIIFAAGYITHQYKQIRSNHLYNVLYWLDVFRSEMWFRVANGEVLTQWHVERGSVSRYTEYYSRWRSLHGKWVAGWISGTGAQSSGSWYRILEWMADRSLSWMLWGLEKKNIEVNCEIQKLTCTSQINHSGISM